MQDTRSVSGWVPEALLAQNAGGYRLQRDFNAVELTVQPGEEVTVSEEVAG